MTIAETLAIYGAPLLLVLGGSLMAWVNHRVMDQARARDRAQADK